ncbi:NAD(P)H-binding protein [Histidinibacterium lentulum]|uniref:Divinyl chlorophyllide a 8-vinyl-reductase, chloroplastic n=1 Tax=Histidinibacterium lentulum TaxID=2480588 RepID=A0A3N2R5U4_9RHOB|nr:NAD(P)H-binding protein [Histidinibacterium lentulum]ROU02860.1 NAD-dependent epimerase/dehydratase family protein [Histidinibacterium lentulum]
MRVLLVGATGTIGRATARALVASGHDAVAVIRPEAVRDTLPRGLRLVEGDPTDGEAMAGLMRAERIEAVISCLASRSGAPRDAEAIDRDAHVALLAAAEDAGAERFVLLSAICVQRPKLAFQRAKLAFEERLKSSPLTWSIVRPTAFFKSLSGQVARVRDGKPYLLFGDGRLTACKPISDDDLGRYLVGCLTEGSRARAVLPVGGPGPALTPRDMGAMLFDLTGRAPVYRSVPPGALRLVAGVLGLAGRVSQRAADKAEFARTGHYYATESMLVWDAARGRYDAEATPEFGNETLREHYARMLAGEVADDRGAHAVF